MLEVLCAQPYHHGMNKIIIFSKLTIATLAASFCCTGLSFATDEKPLFFRAINAGYSDNESSQNYDFIELAKSDAEELDLSDYKILYYNSNDKISGEFEFDAASILQSEHLTLGSAKSPQYVGASDRYLYDFGSSGLATTAGRLQLVWGEEIIDELCWGKIACEQNLAKFTTTAGKNQSAIRCENDCIEPFIYDTYYPEINEAAIVIAEPAPAPPEESIRTCGGFKITEIYSYYETSPSEQFIELYNMTESDNSLDGCVIAFKNHDYSLQGIVAPNSYYAVRDIPLTKNPSSSLAISLQNQQSEIVDEMTYYHGQKVGMSYALIGDE